MILARANSGAAEEGDRGMLGLAFHPEQNLLAIERVIPGSPAEVAGVKAGDLVFSIDGQTTAVVHTLADLKRMLEGNAGTVVRLGVRRIEGDKVRALNFEISRVTAPITSRIGAPKLPRLDAPGSGYREQKSRSSMVGMDARGR